MKGAPRKTTREALLETAGALFAERGLAATSISDIASAASIGKGTFYHYFGSKEALVDALFLPEASILSDLVLNGGEKPTVKETAERLLAFFGGRRLFLAELRSAYRGRAAYGFVELSRSCFVPMINRYYRRDPRYAVEDLATYSELVVGAVLDLCCYRLLEGRIGSDAEALVMLEDLLKRFFDCEP
jgi:AcrR family transcriptional regulator